MRSRKCQQIEKKIPRSQIYRIKKVANLKLEPISYSVWESYERGSKHMRFQSTVFKAPGGDGSIILHNIDWHRKNGVENIAFGEMSYILEVAPIFLWLKFKLCQWNKQCNDQKSRRFARWIKLQKYDAAFGLSRANSVHSLRLTTA